MWAIVVAFGISGEWGKEAILLCAMPPAIMTAMFAAKYDVLKLESSSSTVLGTVVSLFTMAAIMYNVGHRTKLNYRILIHIIFFYHLSERSL